MVYVTQYSHRYGHDVDVFSTLEAAQAYKTAIAEEWWDWEFPDRPRPSLDEIGRIYFNLMEDRVAYVGEWFSISEMVIRDD